jgi:selenide,water dikinase
LAQVLGALNTIEDPQVLVGFSTADDAGVYRLTPDLALVQTVDVFPPVLDDPYWYGAVVGANSLSDIYAMGARPITILNILAFSEKTLPPEMAAEILRGGSDKAREAGVPIIGGHSLRDVEPKYGMAVSGLVHPDKIVTNAGAKPGDVLVLTKPLGSGIITTGLKQELADSAAVEEVTRVMATLNRDASEAMVEVGVNAATDITGFGLMGHLREMLVASGLAATIRWRQVPVIPAALELADRGVAPGGTFTNQANVLPYTNWGDTPAHINIVLCDAQTSGGLLIAVPRERAEALMATMKWRGVEGPRVIGEVHEGQAGTMRVVE